MKKLLLLLTAIIFVFSGLFSQSLGRIEGKTKIIGNDSKTTSTLTTKATFLSEDFEGGVIPTDWEQIDGDCGWMYGTEGSSAYLTIPAHTSYAYANDDACNGDMSDVWLITPSMDFTGTSGLVLEFATFSYNDIFTIKSSIDGGTTWVDLETIGDYNSEWTTIMVDLSSLEGESNVKLAFHYNDGAVWGYGWAIDDVQIYELLVNDLGVTSVTPNFILTGNSATPTVNVYNFGVQTQDDFDITVTINDGTTDVYTSTLNVTGAGLISLSSNIFTMTDEWTTPADGEYTVSASVTLSGDENNTNDEITIDCFVMDIVAFGGNTGTEKYMGVDLSDGATYQLGELGSTDPFPMAEEWDGTNIYRVYSDLSYGMVSTSGEYTAVGTFSGVTGTPSALAYDHINDVMYACVLDASDMPQICTADMATGVLTLINTGTEGMIIAMDFANDGMIYGPDLGDNLYQIDPTTGTLTLVGPLGIDINYGQDVSYDFEVNKLYTISCGEVYELGYYDLSSGAFMSIADIGGDQYGTFVITKTPVGPLPISLLPTDMSTDIAVDATISATFSVDIYETDFSGIMISPDPGNVMASITDNVLTISHDNLSFDTEHTVTIPAASINDGSDDLAFDIIWTFTTALDPTACNDPSDAIFSDIMATTATVSWTENGPATEWNVTYGMVDFDPMTEGTTLVATTNPTIELTGLTGLTNYDVYIQAVCDVSIESGLSGPFQFMSGCITVSELDEGFETSVPPICWDNYQAGAGTKIWTQSDLNPAVGAYSARAGYESSGGTNEQWLVTGNIMIPANHSLTFKATDDMSTDYSSSLVVKITTDSGTSYTDLLTISEVEVTSDTYSPFVIDLATYETQTVKFAFVMIDDDGDNWYLDEVKLEIVSKNEDFISSDISIYPNPSTGKVNINVTENSTVKIIDIAGRIVKDFNINAFEEVNFTQSAGMYVIQIESNSGISTHKLIIN